MARTHHIQQQVSSLPPDKAVRGVTGRLAAAAAGGGLLGGLAMLVLLILYMGTAGMGFATPFNVALAAWVFPIRPPAAMMPALMKALAPMAMTHPAILHAMMALKSGHATNATVATLMGHMPPALKAMALTHMPIVPVHSAVGLILHFAFAIGMGFVFTAILASLAWLRVPGLRNPAGLITASVIGGGLLFLGQLLHHAGRAARPRASPPAPRCWTSSRPWTLLCAASRWQNCCGPHTVRSASLVRRTDKGTATR